MKVTYSTSVVELRVVDGSERYDYIHESLLSKITILPIVVAHTTHSSFL
jgi:hypothetical protein